MAAEPFLTPNGALRAAGRSRTPHRDRHRARCVGASRKVLGSATQSFVRSAIEPLASKTPPSLGEPGQLIKSKIVLTYSKGIGIASRMSHCCYPSIGMYTTRRMHIYFANAGPSILEHWRVSSIEGRNHEGDSEKKAGGMKKSCDAGGNATLLPGGKNIFPLHRSEAAHQYVSVVQNTVKSQRPSREASTFGCYTASHVYTEKLAGFSTP